MTIYVTERFGTFGKDIPTVPNQRFVSGASRSSTIIRGIQTGYALIKQYHKGLTKVGSIVAGAGISGIPGVDIGVETSNNQSQTLRLIHGIRGSKRRYSSPYVCKCKRNAKRKRSIRDYRG